MSSNTTILYNGACPVCRREIDHYRELDQQQEQSLVLADISKPQPLLGEFSLSEDAAKRRLHVVNGDGQLLVGVHAFAAIWDHLPRYRWLAWLVRRPWLIPLLVLGYEGIAFCLYRWDKIRARRRVAAAGKG